jgi:hypothetical protein
MMRYMRRALLLGFVALQVHASNVRTLYGSGLEITVDLTGWTQQQGAAILHGNYARLGLFSAPKEQDLSILVDDIPQGATNLNNLCLGSEKSYGGSKAGVKALETETLAGKPACLFTFPTVMNRRNFYVEMMVEGRWLEIHYSAPDGKDAIGLARQSLEAIVASLVSRPLQSQASELPAADISDEEIALGQSRQGCGAKSKDFVCRALAAFKAGRRPAGRPTPVGVAGITIPIVFGLAVDLIQTRPTYVVVSDSCASTGGFGESKNKDEDKASSQLIRAVKAGQHPDDNNSLVIAARAQTEAKPAGLAERSLVISRGFLRETSMGLIYLAFVPNATGILLGVYPTP